MGGDARSEVTPDTGGAHQHHIRLALLHHLRQKRKMGQCPVWEQTCVIRLQHLIHSKRIKLLFYIFQLIATDQSLQSGAQLCGKAPALGAKLQTHISDLSVFCKFAIY